MADSSKITKKRLKEIIKMTIKTILSEMQKSPSEHQMTGPWTVSMGSKIYSAYKDEDTGVFYYKNMDTATLVPLGTEEDGIQVKPISEETTTSDVGAINLPGSKVGPSGKSGWVASRGGSLKAVEASPSGMSLTPIGKADMKRKQDPVY